MIRGLSMLVRSHMTPNPPTFRAEDTIKQAAYFFHQGHINAAPVINDTGGICGIVTNADIMKAYVDGLGADQPVSAVMTIDVIRVRADDLLTEVIKLPYNHLPVVSSDNSLVGMLSTSDLPKAYDAQLQLTIDEVKALIHSAHEGIVVVDTLGIVTNYNQAAAKLIGLAVEDAIGRPITEVIPNSSLRRVMETGQAEKDCELTLGRRTVFSNRSPIFRGRQVVGALAILQDASELREVVTQLLDVQNHVEDLITIFENTRHGIVVVDAKGTIVRVNKAYEDTFNVSRNEIVGQSVIDIIENTRMHIVAQTGIPEYGVIQKYKNRQIVVNRIPVFRNGKIDGAIGEVMFRDISEVSSQLDRLPQLERQVSRYQAELNGLKGNKHIVEHNFANIIGSSRILAKTKNLALRAAQSDNNVLLLGESGTGKDLFARAIHKASKRQKMPFVTVNCAAVPADLLESELFGYEEGAFTGARKGGKKGKFELADKGTLLLDEIGDMPLVMQAKILRILEDNMVERIGGDSPIACDVRIIAATNKPLTLMVKEGAFREDLYYRLNVIRIHVPPLRDRKEDIGELIEALTPQICRAADRPAFQLSPETMTLIREYGWPGNVRELINLLKQLAATVDDHDILPDHLLEIDPDFVIKPPSLGSENEREYIAQALQISSGNKVLAAKLLGLHRSTLYEKLKKYDLQ
jgi:PAS domain S-box-containing protein